MSQTRPILLSHSLQKWTEMRNMVIKVADKLPSIMQTCLEKFNPVWKRSHLQCHWWWWAVTEGSPAGVIHHNYTSLAQRVCVCVCNIVSETEELPVECVRDADQVSGWPSACYVADNASLCEGPCKLMHLQDESKYKEETKRKVGSIYMCIHGWQCTGVVV